MTEYGGKDHLFLLLCLSFNENDFPPVAPMHTYFKVPLAMIKTHIL